MAPQGLNEVEQTLGARQGRRSWLGNRASLAYLLPENGSSDQLATFSAAAFVPAM
jgi:hypothetical protein